MVPEQKYLPATDGKTRPTHYILYKHRIIPVTAEVKNGVLVQAQTGLPIPEPSELLIEPEDTPYTLSKKLSDYAGEVNIRLKSYREAELALRAKYKRLFSDIDRKDQPEAHAQLRAKYEEEHAAIPALEEKPRFIHVHKKPKLLYEVLSDPLPVLTHDEMRLLFKDDSIKFLTRQAEMQTIMDLMELSPKSIHRNAEAKRYIHNLLAYYVQEGDLPAFTATLSGNKSKIIYNMHEHYLWHADSTDPFINAIITQAPSHYNVQNSALLRSLRDRAYRYNDLTLLDRLDPERVTFDNPYNVFYVAIDHLDFALRNNDKKLLDKPGFLDDALNIIQSAENKDSLPRALINKHNAALTDLLDPDRAHLQRHFNYDKEQWVRDTEQWIKSYSTGEVYRYTARSEPYNAQAVLKYATATNDAKLLTLIDPKGELINSVAGVSIPSTLWSEKESLRREAAVTKESPPKKEKYYTDITTPLVIEKPDVPTDYVAHPGFSMKVYNAVYKSIATAYAIEGAENPQEATYKLALLFDTTDIALNFLRQRVMEKEGSKQPVHDAMLISVPEGTQWHPKAWGELIIAQGSEVLNYLALAPEIEAKIEKRNAQARRQDGESAYQFSIEKLKLKQLSGFAMEIEYPNSELDPEWAYTCQKMNPKVSRWGYEAGLTARQNIAKEDHIPDIGIIDGSKLGFPEYYMAKVPKSDTRLLVMGVLVDCCNHVDGATADMALAAVTDPDGGCYALFKKSGSTTDIQNDRIMGKVSVFRGNTQRSADNRPYTDLVFNSWERVSALANVNRSDGKNIGEVFLAEAAESAIQSATKTKGMESIGQVNLGRNRDGFRSFKRIVNPVQSRSSATASEDANVQYEIASNKAIQRQRVATPTSGWVGSVRPNNSPFSNSGSLSIS